MLVFGSKYIPSQNFVEVATVEDIKRTTPNDIVLLKEFNTPFELAKYCQANRVSYAVKVSSIKDAIYASSLEASFAICSLDLAKNLQKIADNYLWDMKILAIIPNEDLLEEVALSGIDGAVLEAKS